MLQSEQRRAARATSRAQDALDVGRQRLVELDADEEAALLRARTAHRRPDDLARDLLDGAGDFFAALHLVVAHEGEAAGGHVDAVDTEPRGLAETKQMQDAPILGALVDSAFGWIGGVGQHLPVTSTNAAQTLGRSYEVQMTC